MNNDTELFDLADKIYTLHLEVIKLRQMIPLEDFKSFKEVIELEKRILERSIKMARKVLDAMPPEYKKTS